jgi:hypothetical protein
MEEKIFEEKMYEKAIERYNIMVAQYKEWMTQYAINTEGYRQ